MIDLISYDDRDEAVLLLLEEPERGTQSDWNLLQQADISLTPSDYDRLQGQIDGAIGIKCVIVRA